MRVKSVSPNLCGFFLLLTKTFGKVEPKEQSCPRRSLRDVLPTMGEKSSSTKSTTEDVVPLSSVSEFRFNCFKLQELPMDPEQDNFVRRFMKEAVFSKVSPTPLRTKPVLVAVSRDALCEILDLDPKRVEEVEEERQFFAELVAGNRLVEGSAPLSHRYGGHQFGLWADQLGDGRAHVLGEYVNRKGEHWELQLKGSGMTPYSRDGDGRAVLRSSVREFLASEAMFYLGVPTSRAAALVTSDDPVMRDQFYDGHPKHEKASVVLRLAPSWFRIGSLEILSRHGEAASLKKLTDFVIREHFPEIQTTDEDKYLEFLATVVSQTATMIAHWQAIGFTHGVMNTDNLSLLSLTIDYGPYGFLDVYDPDFIPNSSDDWGRYSYSNQPDIARWNLERLGMALVPLMSQQKSGQVMDIMKTYNGKFQSEQSRLFAAKLGLKTVQEGDEALINLLLAMMAQVKTDFTMTFRQLSELDVDSWKSPDCLKKYWALAPLLKHKKWDEFVDLYRKRVKKEKTSTADIQKRMQRVNPRYILRNWMAQSAIEKAEKGDFEEVQLLLRILQKPYATHSEAEERGWAQPPPSWSHKIRVSCSS